MVPSATRVSVQMFEGAPHCLGQVAEAPVGFDDALRQREGIREGVVGERVDQPKRHSVVTIISAGDDILKPNNSTYIFIYIYRYICNYICNNLIISLRIFES